jgi:hypothetical protein
VLHGIASFLVCIERAHQLLLGELLVSFSGLLIAPLRALELRERFASGGQLSDRTFACGLFLCDLIVVRTLPGCAVGSHLGEEHGVIAGITFEGRAGELGVDPAQLEALERKLRNSRTMVRGSNCWIQPQQHIAFEYALAFLHPDLSNHAGFGGLHHLYIGLRDESPFRDRHNIQSSNARPHQYRTKQGAEYPQNRSGTLAWITRCDLEKGRADSRTQAKGGRCGSARLRSNLGGSAHAVAAFSFSGSPGLSALTTASLSPIRTT